MANSGSNTYKVFVYGTLKRGQPNHHVMESKEHGCAKFLGNGCTVSKWPLVVATQYNIPFMLDAEGVGKKICGEVYEVDDRMLKRLDVFENVPAFYSREKLEVTLSEKKDSCDCSCFSYVLKTFKDELLNLSFEENFSALVEYTPPGQRGTPALQLVKK